MKKFKGAPCDPEHCLAQGQLGPSEWWHSLCFHVGGRKGVIGSGTGLHRLSRDGSEPIDRSGALLESGRSTDLERTRMALAQRLYTGIRCPIRLEPQSLDWLCNEYLTSTAVPPARTAFPLVRRVGKKTASLKNNVLWLSELLPLLSSSCGDSISFLLAPKSRQLSVSWLCLALSSSSRLLQLCGPLSCKALADNFALSTEPHRVLHCQLWSTAVRPGATTDAILTSFRLVAKEPAFGLMLQLELEVDSTMHA